MLRVLMDQVTGLEHHKLQILAFFLFGIEEVLIQLLGL
jgi:hypothetical protein